jgi:anhydro-N-acetylmuramic acid kinase
LTSAGEHIVLGLMSGTSLDGLDMALCRFGRTRKGFSYSILRSGTISYSPAWKKALGMMQNTSALDYFKIHHLYGKFIAAHVRCFLSGGGPKPSFIGSHGHTIFHQPQRGFSTQIGCGATIAANTGISTVCDFRNLDVALNGQGAPLVPIGDKLLFPGYESCLNLGGIANISFDDDSRKRIAFDICVANIALNYLAKKLGKEYDENGNAARKGDCIEALLKNLNALDFYRQPSPKSVGREWFEAQMLPLIDNTSLRVEDILCTVCEHIAGQIAKVLNDRKLESVLVSGGGAFNGFLVDKIKENYNGKVVIPDAVTINFKEALIFAFLAWLRMQGEINTLSSVTGARHDSVGGAVYLVKS